MSEDDDDDDDDDDYDVVTKSTRARSAANKFF